MVAVSMEGTDAKRWSAAERRNEPGQAVEQFKGCEAKHFAAVHIGLGEPIHQASLRRGERLETGGGVKPFQSERSSGTLAPETTPSRASTW